MCTESDLSSRLRSEFLWRDTHLKKLAYEAADEIDRLRANNSSVSRTLAADTSARLLAENSNCKKGIQACRCPECPVCNEVTPQEDKNWVIGLIKKSGIYEKSKAWTKVVGKARMPKEIITAPWKRNYVSTVTNSRGEKVDMYIIRDDPTGKSLVTLGVPHGDAALADLVCKTMNEKLGIQWSTKQ